MTTRLRKSRKSGKSIHLISIKKLQKLCEDKWKEVILARDGASCQVKRFHPDIEITHTTTFQADHCFTRANKLLFLDVRNGTMVCSSCNRAKGFGQKSISRAIDDIVKGREGYGFNEMYDIDKQKSANVNWSNRDWLESQLRRLTDELKSITRI